MIEHGVDTTRIVGEITATRLGTFAWLDVLISALVLLLAAFGTGWISTGRALGVTLATCLVGGVGGTSAVLLLRRREPDARPDRSPSPTDVQPARVTVRSR